MPVIQAGTNINKSVVFWGGGTYTANTAAVGYPAINAGTQDTYSSWRPVGTGTHALNVDKGSLGPLSAAGVAAHNLASSGVGTVQIATSPDNSTWTLRATVAVTTNDDIIVLFPTVTARYVRFYWTGPAANIGVFQVASALQFESCAVLDYTPIQHSVNYEKEFNQSITGQKLTNRVIARGAQTSANFPLTSAAFVDGAMLPFESWYNQGGCFFYAGSPHYMPKDMGYCCAADANDIIGVNYIEAGKYANVTFSLDAYRGV